MAPDLSVSLGPLRLKSPVMCASGTFGFGEEYTDYLDLSQLGAVVTKTITLQPREGNPPPRLAETPAGLVNSIGLANPGLEVFLREKLPFLRRRRVPVVVSIAGNTVEEYAELARALEGTAGIAAVEANISCPNVKEGGRLFGSRPATAADVTRVIRRSTSLPLLVKLPPLFPGLMEVAGAVEEAGADALAVTNTLPAMVIDVQARRPVLGAGTGGLSGPAIRPVAVYLVWQVATAVRLPLIGMGGIATASDALEFLIAGASAVAVGTATFGNPRAMVEISTGIAAYLEERGMSNLREIIGSLRPGGCS
ncbi:MAG: dihydroorotate dehydrogenase [Clostridia bacterium]|nr:MAG: dihydroorotate dehydrogenase [Clostridia bacterium]